MAKVKRKVKKEKKTFVSPFKDYWTKENYIIFAVGFIVVFIGFLLMSQGPYDNPVSLHISPIVLLVAYLIIFPLSILFKKKKIEE
jgi:hypothetical protein